MGTLLLFLIGLLYLKRRRIVGLFFLIFGWITLYIASIPFTATLLMGWLERYPPLDMELVRGRADTAIVVLGGPDAYDDAPEYGDDMPGGGALERLRYASYLHRKTDLPILVVGGGTFDWRRPNGEVMDQVLREDFRVPVKWVITRSHNTFDNAEYTREVLKKEGVTSICLVTHAWHMQRSLMAFEGEGFKVIPAPTGFYTRSPMEFGWMPSLRALGKTRWALHEIAGMVWYRAFY
jgi:uncharacterized SAM-binding protein YcdF (DUF218 family)